jgi:hypothetical protein
MGTTLAVYVFMRIRMKLIVRFTLLTCSVAAFCLAFLGTSGTVSAGCGGELALGKITAYRNHIFIDFDMNFSYASPVEFTVTDGAATVGSFTFTSATPGSFSIDFPLDSSVVMELDGLLVDANPDRGCRESAVVTATGMFGTGASSTINIRPQCPDGRLNYNNCDKIAIYPVKDEGKFGLEIWILDKKIVPEFALFISAADLAALPDSPTRVLTVATSQDGLVTLYKHPNGDYQVNYGPDFEGKVFTFRFSGLPPASYPEVTTFMLGALLPRLLPTIS